MKKLIAAAMILFIFGFWFIGSYNSGYNRGYYYPTQSHYSGYSYARSYYYPTNTYYRSPYFSGRGWFNW